MNNIISIKSIFIVLTCLIVFSCAEDIPTPEPENIQEEYSVARVGHTSIDTIYLEWYDHVSRAERQVVRDSYSDPRGDIVILSHELCDNDRDVETWIISFDSGIFNKCCQPPANQVIKDNEGEISKVSDLDMCRDSN